MNEEEKDVINNNKYQIENIQLDNLISTKKTIQRIKQIIKDYENYVNSEV